MYCKRDNVIQLVYDIKAGISYSEGTEEGPRATIFHFSIYLTLWQQSLAYIQVLFVYLYQFSICVACFHVSGHCGPLGSQRSHGTGPIGAVSNLSLHGQQQLH